MAVIMPMRSTLKTITAMKLRKESGSLLDLVEYRNERFLVERAGKPKAVLISLQEYAQLERQRQAARAEFWSLTNTLQQRAARYSSEEVQAAINEAVRAKQPLKPAR
jgi:prevent-host-death family protein